MSLDPKAGPPAVLVDKLLHASANGRMQILVEIAGGPEGLRLDWSALAAD